MTTKVHLSTEFNVGARECLVLMSDPELHRELAELKGMAHRRARNMKLENGVRTWQVDVELLDKVPGFIKGLVREDQLKWVQKFRMDMETLEVDITIEHPLPAKTLTVSGKGRIRETVPEERSVFEVDLEISSGLPLVGKRFEAVLADRLTRMMNVDFQIRHDYVEQHRGRLKGRDVSEGGKSSEGEEASGTGESSGGEASS